MALPQRYLSWLLIATFIVALGTMAMTVPPLQSPDEPDHVRRAYLLGQGQLLLETPDGQMSGGWIDPALNAYLVPYHQLSFPDFRTRRFSVSEAQALSDIEWSGERTVFTLAPGTGYYFPAIYLPQALGLQLGELVGLSVETSYRLARLFALLASIGLVIAAVRFYRMPASVGALLLLPMSVFQVVSASIDGTANGLLVLAASLFLAVWHEHVARPRRAFALMCVCVFVVVTCRYHLMTLLLLPFVLAWRLRSRDGLIMAIATTVVALAWTAWAMGSTVDTRSDVGAAASTIIAHYLFDPLEFARVFFRSWAEPGLRELYYESFLGRLAALDIRYTKMEYLLLGSLMLLAAGLSVDVRGWRIDWPSRAAMLACGLCAIPLVYLAMLIAWTPHPAYVVYGVQGRYFVGPLIIVAYALGPVRGAPMSPGQQAGWGVAWLLFAFSAITIPGLMLERFYLLP